MHDTLDDVIHRGLYRHFYIEDRPVWVIGDVHGCHKQFRTLCAKIKEADPNASIYQLGDLIDRGPGLIEVVDVVDQYDVRCTIGNHEVNFLLELHGFKQCRSKARRATHDKFNRLSGTDQDRVVNCLQRMTNMVGVQLDNGEHWTLSHSPVRNHDILTEGMSASAYCMTNVPYSDSVFDANCVHGHQHWNYRHITEQINDPLQEWYNIDGGCCYGGHLVGFNLNHKHAIWVLGVDYES